MGFLQRLVDRFGKTASSATDAAAADPPLPALPWRGGTSMRIPDWQALWEASPRDDGDEVQQAYWATVAVDWLRHLRNDLGAGYAIARSEHFALLGALDVRIAQLALETCERDRHRILRALPGIVADEGFGPFVLLVFDTPERYYDYIDNYYPDPGDYAQSSGIFLDHGYAHFAFCADASWRMEGVIAHELTHCLLRHLPLPAWLNEGIAVNIEHRLNPAANQPAAAMQRLADLRPQRQAFWNAATIQEFWSGTAFLRPDEGSALSYDLGETLVGLLAKDYPAFASFATTARREDAGAAAALAACGLDLGDCVAAVLGDGDWSPRPGQWTAGVERGQFRGTSASPQRAATVPGQGCCVAVASKASANSAS